MVSVVSNKLMEIMAFVQSRLARNEEGQTLVEYGLIIVLIGLIIVAAFALLLDDAFADLGARIAAALSSS